MYTVGRERNEKYDAATECDSGTVDQLVVALFTISSLHS